MFKNILGKFISKNSIKSKQFDLSKLSADSKNMGAKGTYIKIINKNFIKERGF